MFKKIETTVLLRSTYSLATIDIELQIKSPIAPETKKENTVKTT
jgi:hypothetical protein